MAVDLRKTTPWGYGSRLFGRDDGEGLNAATTQTQFSNGGRRGCGHLEAPISRRCEPMGSGEFEDTGACRPGRRAGTHTAESLHEARWQSTFAKPLPGVMGPGSSAGTTERGLNVTASGALEIVAAICPVAIYVRVRRHGRHG